jgi:hypothetical protein
MLLKGKLLVGKLFIGLLFGPSEKQSEGSNGYRNIYPTRIKKLYEDEDEVIMLAILDAL